MIQVQRVFDVDHAQSFAAAIALGALAFSVTGAMAQTTKLRFTLIGSCKASTPGTTGRRTGAHFAAEKLTSSSTKVKVRRRR